MWVQIHQTAAMCDVPLIIGLGDIIQRVVFILWIGKGQRSAKRKGEVPEARFGRATRLGNYGLYGSCRPREHTVPFDQGGSDR